jgi:hypothetical protein
MRFVGISVVKLLVMRKNDSSVFGCYILWHLIHPVYTYSVATVHIARSSKRGALQLKCTYCLTCVVLFCILLSLSWTVFTLRAFVSHLYSVCFKQCGALSTVHTVLRVARAELRYDLSQINPPRSGYSAVVWLQPHDRIEFITTYFNWLF